MIAVVIDFLVELAVRDRTAVIVLGAVGVALLAVLVFSVARR